MTEIFIALPKYFWISDFTALCVMGALATKQRQNSSSLMTLALVVIFSRVFIGYEPLVKSFTAPTAGQIIFALWCTGFMIFDCIMAWVLYRYYREIKIKFNSIFSSMFALTAWAFVFYLVYLQYGPLLFGIEGPSYKDWKLAVYYLGLTLLNAFVIYSIHRAHLFGKKTYSLLAKMYVLAFFIEANMQMFTFYELFLLKTRELEGVFLYCFASINICTSAATLLVACLAVFQFYKKTDRTGALWQL